MSSILHGSESMSVAASSSPHRAFCFAGFFSDDADHSIDRVCSPYRPARATNHLDPFYVFQWKVECLQENAAEGGRIHLASIQQHQQFVAELTIQSSGGNRPGVGADLRDVHS